MLPQWGHEASHWHMFAARRVLHAKSHRSRYTGFYIAAVLFCYCRITFFEWTTTASPLMSSPLLSLWNETRLVRSTTTCFRGVWLVNCSCCDLQAPYGLVVSKWKTYYYCIWRTYWRWHKEFYKQFRIQKIEWPKLHEPWTCSPQHLTELYQVWSVPFLCSAC